MVKKSFIDTLFQNARNPKGFLGRLVLRGMNSGHASLSRWGMSQLEWQPDWSVLDIGCGGGANLSEILRRCPGGKAYGVDLSWESVGFARRKNKKHLGTRCFVEQGTADRLPCDKGMFDAVTAFETVYFWSDLPRAFAEVARVLRPKGYFLICCEAGDPADETWTRRIEGMVIHPAEELEALLTEAGFGNIAVCRRKKKELCIVARKQSIAKLKKE